MPDGLYHIDCIGRIEGFDPNRPLTPEDQQELDRCVAAITKELEEKERLRPWSRKAMDWLARRIAAHRTDVSR
jgi:hypothetical protein